MRPLTPKSNNPLYSIRINSKKTYNRGLFIADFQAMPYGCSIWPAFWSTGPNWPNEGTQPGLSFFNSSENFCQGKSISLKVFTINFITNIPSIPAQAAVCLRWLISRLLGR